MDALSTLQTQDDHFHEPQPENSLQQEPLPEPFIVVKALYAFHSEDPASLSFQKGELIQVLTQLESGWWYGYCPGARGWFPSNYVEIVNENFEDDDGHTVESHEEEYKGEEEEDEDEDENNRGDDEDEDEDQDDDDDEMILTAQREMTLLQQQQQQRQQRASAHQPTQRVKAPQHGRAHGKLRPSRPSAIKPQLLDGDDSGLPPLPPVSNPFDPEPTWESLADHSTGALQNLLHSAEKGYKSYYQIQATQVVEAVRVMLYASGTVDKDSAPIRMHRGLKLHHRQIMAALSKLVLSAKMASGVWPAEGAVTKMLADANDVAQAVHQFIFTAQGAGVQVHDVDAKLILGTNKPSMITSGRKPSLAFSASSIASSQASTDVSPGLLSQLDYYYKSSTRALGQLSSQLQNAIEGSLTSAPAPTSSRLSLGPSILSSSQSSLLVSQCQLTISEMGSLLNLVADFYNQTLREYPTIHDQIYIEVRSAKQTLYNNVAALVMAIQLTTDPMVQTSVLQMALEATTTAEKSATTLVGYTQTLATEREKAVRLGKPRGHESTATLVAQPPPSYAPHQRQTEIDHYFQEQHDPDQEAGHDARNRSDSIGSGPSSFSAPTTPGGETAGRSHAQMMMLNHHMTQVGETGQYAAAASARQMTSPRPSSPNSTNIESDIRGEKLKKMLGDDAPGVRQKSADQPWFLGHDYSQADISFNLDGQVKGGTLPALVERLTMHDGLDASFVSTFLLTYRSFASSSEFFSILFRRFTISPPAGLESNELQLWTERKQTPIRLRVFNIIKSWLESHYQEDVAEDREMLQKIKAFSESHVLRETMGFAAVQLIKLVEKRETSDGSLRRMVLNLTTQAPTPILPRNLKRIRFMDLDPLELARQLTIMEAALYNRVKPTELLDTKDWKGEDQRRSPNVRATIDSSNKTTQWFTELIVSETDIKKRVAIIKQLLLLADKLRQLNNFSSLAAINAVFAGSAVHRLHRTLEALPSKVRASMLTLQELWDPSRNWTGYRTELHKTNPPMVPFMGMYLTDLFMNHEGNKNMFMKGDVTHINFFKRVGAAEIIREVQQYQHVPYGLTPVPEIQTYIKRTMDKAKPLTDLYDMGLAIEPR
ncbi:hypothetical protein BGZ83_011691 [Gryganskiella cystojenkinii]|nr:hypothetical protein BGZ83_011691 [Gryganskiella cystojenkinii]